jgi:DNA repair exonuclease SbcCD nuclease subunit
MIALITDLHFGMKNGNKTLFEDQFKFFEQQFFPFLLQHNIKNVICCGDFFDSRTSVDVFILQEIKEKFVTFLDDNDITFHMILGNHDIVYNNTLHYNSIKATGLDKYFVVYDKPKKVSIGHLNIAMMPWIVDGKLDIPSGVDVVCGHFDIIGFEMVKGIDSKHGFSVNDFNNHKLVLSGHYHLQNKIKNIQYLGNPYQKDWGDCNTQKGFWTLDDDLSMKFYENCTSMKHIKLMFDESPEGFVCRSVGLGMSDVHITSTKEIALLKYVCYNNKVKMIINSFETEKNFGKIYTTLVVAMGESGSIELINTAEVVQNLDEERMANEIKEDSDVLGNMKLYTESVEVAESIDKDLLTGMFEQLYKETVTGSV